MQFYIVFFFLYLLVFFDSQATINFFGKINRHEKIHNIVIEFEFL